MEKYDKYYKENNYFGNPYSGLMDFFLTQEKGTLVDLGAGQGRDSIPLSQMNYKVTAVDISSVGIKQIQNKDSAINAVVADLYTFDVSDFDYILMNSIVHFYKQNIKKETELINQILSQMKPNAVFVNCLLKNKEAEMHLKKMISQFNVQIIHESYVDYPDFGAVYHLYIVKKQ